MATKYVLEMQNEEQARMVVAALDFWIRMRIGQWKDLVDLCLHFDKENIKEWCQRRDGAELLIMGVRGKVMPELRYNASYGVFKFPETERAFNLLKAVRSAIAWHNKPEGGWTVDFDRPMVMEVKEELPECKAVEEGRNEK